MVSDPSPSVHIGTFWLGSVYLWYILKIAAEILEDTPYVDMPIITDILLQQDDGTLDSLYATLSCVCDIYEKNNISIFLKFEIKII